MITLKLGWLVLESILIGFFLYFGSSAALAIAIMMILVPLFSIPINLYIRKKLRVELSAGSIIKKGDQGSIKVKFDNPTLFPVLRSCCKLQSENQLNRQTQLIEIKTWFPARRIQQTMLQTGSNYCGRIRISVAQIRLYDCFGLIGIRCNCNAAGYMTVQPDTFEMNVNLIPTPDSIEDSEVYSQERPGADLTETYQIREYVPGDNPRQIHWKLTSKFDKLIVRDPALPITRNILIFWERTGETGNLKAIDAQAEILVSLCRSLLDQSIQFTVGWNDTDRNLCILQEIRDLDELVGMIPRILRATGAKEGMSGAELLLQTSGHALCAHMVYLAEEPQSSVVELQQFGHVSMLLCGNTPLEGALMFDTEHYEEQLTQIEL